MDWFLGVLHAHPEGGFFFMLGIGYFKLCVVTGTLLAAGVAVGQFGVTVLPETK